jgi:hypothetical protein
MRKRNLLIVFLAFLVAACQPAPSSVQTGTAAPTGTPADKWQALFGHTPVPWTTPLPPEEATVLDATYVKTNPRLATPFPCKRCPDYALEGGLWKLSLDKGVFRILYTLNGWRSLKAVTQTDSIMPTVTHRPRTPHGVLCMRGRWHTCPPTPLRFGDHVAYGARGCVTVKGIK